MQREIRLTSHNMPHVLYQQHTINIIYVISLYLKDVLQEKWPSTVTLTLGDGELQEHIRICHL